MPRKNPPRAPSRAASTASKKAAVPEGPLCRSCGNRPGRPMTMIGQLTQSVLCEVCAELRKERIRANRAAARAGGGRIR